MKRRILLFIVLLPVAAAAQQGDLGLPSHDVEPAISKQAGMSPPSAYEDIAPENAKIPNSRADLAQGPSSTPSQNGKTPQPQPQTSKAGDEGTSASTSGSMAGYIDNAIVGSQIVIRFESEIQNLTPDLAEFLYPKCSCGYSPEGPGPSGLATNVNAQMLHTYGEYALNRRFSVFTEVPVRWIQPQSFVIGSGATVGTTLNTFSNQGGLGDVIAGFKFAMLASRQHYLTIDIQASFPSGNSSRGLGTNHFSVQPSVLYYQRVTRRITLESEFGDLHPIGGSPGYSSSSSPATGGFAGDVLTYGVGPSYKLFDGHNIQFAPLVEFIGWRLLGGFVTGGPIGLPPNDSTTCGSGASTPFACSKSGTNILNLKGGARITFGAHNSIYIGYGRALTPLYWYLRVMRIEYRYSFGSDTAP